MRASANPFPTLDTRRLGEWPPSRPLARRKERLAGSSVTCGGRRRDCAARCVCRTLTPNPVGASCAVRAGPPARSGAWCPASWRGCGGRAYLRARPQQPRHDAHNRQADDRSRPDQSLRCGCGVERDWEPKSRRPGSPRAFCVWIGSDARRRQAITSDAGRRHHRRRRSHHRHRRRSHRRHRRRSRRRHHPSDRRRRRPYGRHRRHRCAGDPAPH